ncbi:beta-1,3-galactosyltransferase 6-like [Saccoglossus kowalevskii]|uniref:Hexosyltransferase n=1 Tax=Saccoglossus kowalevskii TaxID=10224 RepID=A0ABM0GQU5_SACKO|nr:PREDICTED: beta-1,3-galactosyltransferase 6-like [Saccoglossus kowalevskii]
MPRIHPGTLLKVLPLICFFVFLIYMSACNIEQYCPPCSRAESDNQMKKEPPKSMSKRQETFLAVMIMTGPKNIERRNTIRQTWLLNHRRDVMPRFVIGIEGLNLMEREQLEIEQSEHGDLLLLPTLQDAYNKLTEKLLKMYIWLDQNVNFTFVLKADDDTFARLDIIVSELHTMHPAVVYWGFFDGRAMAKKRGKWAEEDWKLCDRYLPYALGGGYILSHDLVHFVARNSDYLKLYNNEDVSLGVWLAPVEINRIHDTRFNTEYLSRGCNNGYIVTHKQTIQDMFENQKQLTMHNRLCEREVQLRKSYLYNWDKLPSACCPREVGIP